MEFNILYTINSLHNEILDKIMILITSLGNSGFIWILIDIILTLKEKTRKCGILMLVSMFIGVIIGNIFIKNLVARQRPCWIDENIKLLIKCPKDYSFPSGHTMASFAASTIIWLYNKKIGIITICLSFLIAFSRMYLFVHFPTDVIAGMLLGIAIALLVYYSYKKFERYQIEKKKS